MQRMDINELELCAYAIYFRCSLQQWDFEPLHLNISADFDTVCVQLGNVISANIYRTSDAPLYHKGNTHLIIINVLIILLFLFTKVYYVMRNRLRDKKWNVMTTEVSYI